MSFQENNINIVVLADIIVFIGFIVGMIPLYLVLRAPVHRDRHQGKDADADGQYRDVAAQLAENQSWTFQP
jgi:hypothetical protein